MKYLPQHMISHPNEVKKVKLWDYRVWQRSQLPVGICEQPSLEKLPSSKIAKVGIAISEKFFKDIITNK